MLSCLPVVACDIKGVREMVRDGTTGLLVPPGNGPALAAALSRLIEAPALRATMGEAGRLRAVRDYDQAVVLAHTLDALGL